MGADGTCDHNFVVIQDTRSNKLLPAVLPQSVYNKTNRCRWDGGGGARRQETKVLVALLQQTVSVCVLIDCPDMKAVGLAVNKGRGSTGLNPYPLEWKR